MKAKKGRPAALESRYLAILSLVLILFTVAGAIGYRSISHYRETRRDIQELLETTEAIRYYDEVLTTSARMAAFTGADHWRRRYDETLPKLDKAIELAVAHFPKAREAIEQTRTANQRLVSTERLAFELAARGRLGEASRLMLNNAYENDKANYSEGLTRLTDEIHSYRDHIEILLARRMETTGIVLAALFSTVILALFYGFRLIAERFDLERLMSEAGRQLLTYDGTEDDDRLRWILKLLATKAQAEHALLLHRKRGMDSEWRLLASTGGPILNFSASELDALVSPPDEDGIVRTESPAALPDAPASLRAALEHAGIVSMLGIVLNHGNGDEYYLGLAGGKRKLHWGESEAPILRTLAELMAGAMEIREKEAELYRLATTDDLTGLDNRRHFTEALEREMQRVARTGQPSALLMIDLDHFKQVNDTYGHAIGDRLLRQFAREARRQMREIDVLGRIGGEEFAVLLPETDSERAMAAAERLRSELTRLSIDTGSGSLQFTASIGVTLIRSHDEAYGAVLKRADRALYAAKNGGRNCVRFNA